MISMITHKPRENTINGQSLGSLAGFPSQIPRLQGDDGVFYVLFMTMNLNATDPLNSVQGEGGFLGVMPEEACSQFHGRKSSFSMVC